MSTETEPRVSVDAVPDPPTARMQATVLALADVDPETLEKLDG